MRKAISAPPKPTTLSVLHIQPTPPAAPSTPKEKPAISSLLDPSASLPLYQPTHLQPTIQRL